MRLGTSREAGLGHAQHQEGVPWGIATKRLSIDGQGRVVYRYKQPFRDGSTHVILEPLDS